MDIAQIGFSADTSGLTDAKGKLDAMSASGAKAERATDKILKALDSLNATSAALAKAVNSLSASLGKATGGLSAEATAATNAAAAVDKKAKATERATAATNAAAAASKSAANASKAAAAAAEKQWEVMSRINRITGVSGSTKSARASASVFEKMPEPTPKRPANTNISQFNTGNIAAQFQDIGVTAAMGMDPMMIAFQQGTQLSAIFAQMENPLKGIATALKSVFSVTSLLTIGLVALLAAGLQFVNWTKVAKEGLNLLADGIEVLGPYAAAAAAGLALIYSPAIVAGIASVTMSVYGLGVTAVKAAASFVTAWLAAATPFTLIGLAIAGVLTGLYVFRDSLKEVLGVDLIGYAKDGANFIIGAFVGAFNAVKETWSQLPGVYGDYIMQTVNVFLTGIAKMVNASIEAINKVNSLIGRNGELITFRMDENGISNPFEGQAKKAAETFSDEMNKALQFDYLGAAGEAVVSGMSGVADKLRAFSASIKEGDDKKKKGRHGKTDAEKFDDIVRGAENTIASLKAEQAALGMTAEQAARLRYETDLLNKANQKNIKLTPEMVAELKGYAQTMASIEVETARMKEAIDFQKDITRGFFSDMRSGLRDGESMWTSFGNAVTSALDKIIDKFMDQTFDMIFGGGSAGSGGALSFLGSIGSMLGFAKGGAFDSGVQRFAKGGTFTNGIVNKPTLFSFANGGSFGQMGEAGPEAIMPLKRGSDGSLGVEAFGTPSAGTGSSPTLVVNVINNANTNVRTAPGTDGADLNVIIDQANAALLSDPGSQTSQAMRAANGQSLKRR